MNLLKPHAKAKKKFKVITDSKHTLPMASNLLNRNFSTKGPNQKLLGDISYASKDEGWMYLAVVIDLYARAVIGWSIQPTMVCDALIMALWRRRFPRDVLFDSDRSSQYCSNDFEKLLKVNGITCSMSRKGNCWDNTGLYLTSGRAKNSIFHYIEVYYNFIRRHSAIGSISPEVLRSN